MKKIFSLLVLVATLAVLSVPGFAQGRGCRRGYDSRSYDSRGYYDNSRAYYDYGNRNRSVWDKHRDKITVAGGTVAGAVIGGLIGGRRGAAIGALAGLGGSALYTYKIRDRRFRY